MGTEISLPKLPGRKSLTESRIERNGLSAGTVAPEFTLPDVKGVTISLEKYRGRRVLLVFSDPHCNRQKAEAHGFEFPVVLQHRWKLSKKYGIFATPVAFVIGEDGRTARDVAVGVDQIRAVLHEEFLHTAVERFIDTREDISRVLSSPIPRRQAFRIAASMAAGALFSVIGMQKTAIALACSTGFTACGTACCNNSNQICCNATTNACCATSLVCCNGKCCAPGQVCSFGSCQQQFLP